MPWNLSSCSESSLKAGVSSTSSSLMSPRRWLLAALTDSFRDKPSSGAPSDRFDNEMRLHLMSRCRRKRTHAYGSVVGPRPLQRIRLATEAAGATGVVDRSSPSEHEGASHRSTHGFRQDYPMRTPLRLWQFHQGGAGSFVPYLYIYVCAPTRRGGWLGRASCPGAGSPAGLDLDQSLLYGVEDGLRPVIDP